ncbi:MAG: hypothetical protein H6840_06745 [Planctomycetes bacterium]|nr:hypothetical protein [Planctomycetota bacterium]
MAKPIVAFLCGILFAGGLVVSQMTLPTRVTGFLDFFGRWDPTLMFVMGGAIAVYLPVWTFMRGRRPVFAAVALPRKVAHDLDARLFIGAGIFGIGWGMAGICPGPGVVLLGRGSVDFALFVAAMLAGMLLHKAVPRKQIAAAMG